jgi:hypothetical protein
MTTAHSFVLAAPWGLPYVTDRYGSVPDQVRLACAPTPIALNHHFAAVTPASMPYIVGRLRADLHDKGAIHAFLARQTA